MISVMYRFRNNNQRRKVKYDIMAVPKFPVKNTMNFFMDNSLDIRPIFTNIVAAFQGMHVSPAKHSYA